MSKTCPKNITPIMPSECLGNTREKLNANFNLTKDAICTLTAGLSSITERLRFLPPVGTIVRFWGDIRPGGSNFDLTGRGKIIAANSQNLSPWALCNGNNTTPDLRDRFIVGAGNLYNQSFPTGNRGPIHNSTASLQFSSIQLTIPELPIHNHSILDGVNNLGHNHPITILPHDHDYSDLYIGGSMSVVNPGALYFTWIPWGVPPIFPIVPLFKKIEGTVPVAGVSGSGSNANTVRRFTEPNISNMAPTTSNDSTGITSQFTGNDVRHENRPPYRALGFIMRVV